MDNIVQEAVSLWGEVRGWICCSKRTREEDVALQEAEAAAQAAMVQAATPKSSHSRLGKQVSFVVTEDADAAIAGGENAEEERLQEQDMVLIKHTESEGGTSSIKAMVRMETKTTNVLKMKPADTGPLPESSFGFGFGMAPAEPDCAGAASTTASAVAADLGGDDFGIGQPRKLRVLAAVVKLASLRPKGKASGSEGAATAIQAAFRGAQVRKTGSLQSSRDAATAIQSAFRGQRVRRSLQDAASDISEDGRAEDDGAGDNDGAERMGRKMTLLEEMEMQDMDSF